MAGNALGSTPVLDRPTIESFYRTHEPAEGLAREDKLLPDHYPLVTRSGTVPVGELAMRGLYSQARYRALAYAADYAPPQPHVEEWRPPASDAAVATDHPAPHPEPGAATGGAAAEPLELAAGPVLVEGQGRAKTVDANAALAMR